MKVVLAEKPSVARDLAAFLGARSRADGYLEGNGWQVTWAFGHLVELKDASDYEASLKRWTLEALPFVPARFELKLRAGDAGVRRQFEVIASLFRGADEIVCATDAGREGELIFRYIVELAQAGDKPMRRLWLSSLTEEAIAAAFAKLKPASDYENLHAAARSRAQADWVVGINGTRYFTVRNRPTGVMLSVGRVQTPVLALIVGRDDEIRHFVPAAFFELLTRYRGVEFKHVTAERMAKKDDAEALLAQVRGAPLVVKDVKKRKEEQQPPQLFDLTELQREMNRRFGTSAADVLKTAQELYESKVLTYPRTDSRYLPVAMKKEVGALLAKLKPLRPEAIARLDLARLPESKRIFDDKKVSDHHAILPTGKLPGALGQDAGRVFEAVVTRLVAAFHPPCIKEVTTVDAESAGVPFRARGVRVLAPGWTELYPKPAKKDGEADDEQEMPAFAAGESGPHEPWIKEGQTTPPKPFDENQLLGAMETAGKLVDDEQLREALKERGLGTPATRAQIIETLIQRGYVARDKKKLLATDLGRFLVYLIHDPLLKSPELTGEWEARLKAVEQGKLDAAEFMAGIADYVTKLVRGDDAAPPAGGLGSCPRCGAPVIEGQRGYGCARWKEGCGFVLWKEQNGFALDRDAARRLIHHRVLPYAIRRGDQPPALVCMSAQGRVAVLAKPPPRERTPAPETPRAETPPAKPEAAPAPKCPLCGKGLVETPRFFGCAAWREGCAFRVEKTIAGKAISKATAKRLIERGRTGVLKGFAEGGAEFSARIVLDERKRVRLEREA